MNIVNNYYLKLYLMLLTAICTLFTQAIDAAEWWDTIEQQSGFTEFAPPASHSEYNNNKAKEHWRSGSSFNENNKVRYLPMPSRNPWKPVNSLHYKKSFNSQRPWGNIPDRTPGNTNNMKFHDQRFKQWSHQLDSAYQNNMMLSDPLTSYDNYSLPFMNGYGYPGSIYNNPLITPPIYPGLISNTAGYGPIAGGGLYPNTGLSTRPWLW